MLGARGGGGGGENKFRHERNKLFGARGENGGFKVKAAPARMRC